MTKEIYRGWLHLGINAGDENILQLIEDKEQCGRSSQDILAESIQDDMRTYGCYLSVSYFVADKELSSDELQEHFLNSLYGDSSAWYHVAWSEITGYLWTNEEIMVGGHDLLEELKGNVGKFLHLEIEYSHENKAN